MKNIFEVIEQKPIQVVVGLLLFHITVASLASFIAHSPYLSHLHNNMGFWYFAADSMLYHREGVVLSKVLDSGAWVEWWWYFDYGHLAIEHAHIRWIGLIYWVFGEENPLLFEIVNSVTWVTSVVLLYLAAHIIFNGNRVVAGLSGLFFFFPTVLLSSTQLLREPFYLLGICSVIFGWAAISREDSIWKGVVAIVIGFFLITEIRGYVTPLLLTIFSVFTLILLFTRTIARFPALVLLLFIFAISFQDNSLRILGGLPTKTSPKANAEINKAMGNTRGGDANWVNAGEDKTNEENEFEESNLNFIDLIYEIWKVAGEHSSRPISGDLIGPVLENDNEGLKQVIYRRQMELLRHSQHSGATGFIRYLNEKIAIRLSIMRYGFGRDNRSATSKIDNTVQFMNIKELIVYLPRALQVGFLSPFPSLWLSKGSRIGFVGRAISGVETLIMYLIFAGFFAIFFMEIKIIKSLVPVLIFSVIMILLLGLVVPNVGAIYRMRQGLFIPFFMFGVYGLTLLSVKIKSKT